MPALRKHGRPEVSEKLLLLALYVNHRYDGRREEQCQHLFDLSQMLERPLVRPPAQWTFVRYLRRAEEKGLKIEAGKAIFQDLTGGAL